MLATLEQHLDLLVANGQAKLLTQLNHGIEKEGLRVDAQGHLAQTDHPRALGSALTHPQITTDYSEALLEFITPVCDSPAQALEQLANLHRYAFDNLGDEELWAASMPCDIASEAQIRIAEYGRSNVGQLKHIYRVGLEHRYGKMMQTIAGIHYNFSLSEAFWPIYQSLTGAEGDSNAFQSAGYFKLIRNFRRYSWLLLYLFGASPALSASFLQGRQHQLHQLGRDTLFLPHATSLRMSDLGYSNRAQSALNICFNHLSTYANSLSQAIRTPHPAYERIGVRVDGHYNQLNTNVLQIENEYYSDIRPKRVTRSGEKPVQALIARGVEYIEVRNTDINPLLPLGIDLEQARFMDAFLLTCLLCSDELVGDSECERIAVNHERIVNRGREPGLTLFGEQGERSVAEQGRIILNQVRLTAEVLDGVTTNSHYRGAVDAQYAKLEEPDLTPSAQVLAAIHEHGEGYTSWALAQSRRHRSTLSAEPLSQAQQLAFKEVSARSLQEQAEIEAGDTLDFDQYLAQYLAQ
ncbi:glutamate--cysteine ligase [Marinobacterium sp. D7]|uniref:glutamate--cysteine ligase n=1 Tax=Marinobacterium ramblicola TaxID=2849041 RepID=UPI001C2D0BE0|nr:glutamate--cysteine ligase [Marinobacterium ramblicola]